MKEIRFTIEGDIPSKDNLYHKTSRHNRWYKDKKVGAYEDSFFYQVPKIARKMIDKPVTVGLKLYYSSKRCDTINCWKIIGDCLELSGVLKNDRLIETGWFMRYLDKENPRVEIIINPR